MRPVRCPIDASGPVSDRWSSAVQEAQLQRGVFAPEGSTDLQTHWEEDLGGFRVGEPSDGPPNYHAHPVPFRRISRQAMHKLQCPSSLVEEFVLAWTLFLWSGTYCPVGHCRF